jgi:ATP-dependent helicase/nuclease subunit A
MTYAAKNLEKDLHEISARMYVGDPELMAQDVVCPGQWVLMAAMQRTEAGQLFALGGRPMRTVTTNHPWNIRVVTGTQEGTQTVQEAQASLPEHLQERIRQGLSFQYPHMAAMAAPSKQTATQRKGRDKDAEAAEHAKTLPEHTFHWRRPFFLETKRDAAALGTAMHTCLQHICYKACGDKNGVDAELRRMALEGLLTPQQEEMIDAEELTRLFQSPLGKRLATCHQVLREFKFSILEAGETVDDALKEEQILLQGVVDCAMIEDDGITVVDFKTDRVTQETVGARAQHYAPQVEAYADALARIFEKPVKEKLLYFFRLAKTVTLD